ncbi:MAG: cyclodeaminase/cyclohydrolase family protein [Chloroflexota bacterium]
MYSDQQVGEFLVELSSGSPTPGGGSAAALCGATGAALVSMVCNLTIGREKYREVEAELRQILDRAERLRSQLLGKIDEDINAYRALSTAMKLPRASDEDRRARTQAVQTALVSATTVPLEIARLCREVMSLCAPATEKGNVNAVSDAGVGALAAEAGLRSAALNVQINLSSLKDPEFAGKVKAELDGYLEGSAAFKEEILRAVTAKL